MRNSFVLHKTTNQPVSSEGSGNKNPSPNAFELLNLVRSLVEGDILSRNVRQVDSNDTVSYHRKGVISRQMTIWVQLMSQPGIEIKAISMTLLSIQIHSLDFIYELPSIMNHSHCHCIGFRGCNSLGSEGEVLARRSQFIHGLGPST